MLDFSNMGTKVPGIFLGVVAVVILLCIFNPIAIVGVGERGVKVTLGKVSPKNYPEGIHLITPAISKMHVMNVKTKKEKISTEV